MPYLSEDPTYLAGGLGVLGVALLIALRVTRQGRYLIRALIALGLAAGVLVAEHFWVTDAERIERVVYDLRDAVAAADVERVLSYLTPDVQFVQGGSATTGVATRASIRATLSNAKFDFLRISHLRAEAFPQSRRGSAEFRIIAGGSIQGPLVRLNFGTANSAWSLGLTETSPRVWKVDPGSPQPSFPARCPAPRARAHRRPGSRSRDERPRLSRSRQPGPSRGCCATPATQSLLPKREVIPGLFLIELTGSIPCRRGGSA